MNYAEALNTLQTRGYYIGTFDDFWQDNNGITKEQWDWAVNVFRNTAKNPNDLYLYRHNYTDQKPMLLPQKQQNCLLLIMLLLQMLICICKKYHY